jgi:5-formyltetrahydrofolate cyclo-ligase
VRQDKAQLRAELKRTRLAIDTDQRAIKSSLIQEKLLNLIDWTKINTLHVYEPIEKLGEVDLAGFTKTVQDKYPEVHIFTTRQFDDIWEVVHIDGNKLIKAPGFDVVIVPMLGFDKTLHRLGYGGGFYDKFLATQPRALKIGVCFEAGKIDEMPIEPHDVAMNKIITEETTYALDEG